MAGSGVDATRLPGLSVRGMAGHYVSRLRDREYRHAMRLARRGLRFPTRAKGADPPEAIWAVAMVKNEADIIGATVRHLLDQGVDRVLVADNGSEDGTVEALQPFAALGSTIVARDDEVAYFQAAKMTTLGRFAARHGASWVIPFDADELWFAPDVTLAEFLRSAGDATVARADIYNVFPTDAGTWRLDQRLHELRKVAFRPHPLALLHIGNHWTSRAGVIDTRLRIAHVPWRSEDQLTRKFRQGAAAFARVPVETHVGAHWRRSDSLDDEALSALWRDVVTGRPNASLGWSPSGEPMVAADPFAWTSWPPDLVDTGR